MYPLTITAAVGIARKDFETIKAGFQLGRYVESMPGDLGRWMGAVSDVDNAEKMAKNPPLFKKLMFSGSIEQQAIEAFAAKKKLEQQRAELKQFLIFTYGMSAWNELLAMEGKIRKDRAEMIYKKKEAIQKFINVIAIIVLTLTIFGFFALLIYLWKNKNS